MDYISYVRSGSKNSKEVIDIINEKAYSLDLLRTFREENFLILDGKQPYGL